MIRKIVVSALLAALCSVPGWSQEGPPQTPPDRGSIEGIVFDAEGKPLAQARVYVTLVGQPPQGRIRYQHTDAEGKFVIPDVVAGSHVVHADHRQKGYPDTFFAFFAQNPAANPIVNVAAGEVASVQVRLGPQAATLQLAVIDGVTGEPVPGAQTRLALADKPEVFISTAADLEGRINTPVPAGTAFTIEINSPDYRIWRLSEPALQLGPGESRVVEAKLLRK